MSRVEKIATKGGVMSKERYIEQLEYVLWCRSRKKQTAKAQSLNEYMKERRFLKIA